MATQVDGQGVPAAVSSWFRSSYGCVTLDPTWLSECYACLKAKYPEEKTPSLIKRAESQLLLSSLSSSTSLPPPMPASRIPSQATTSTIVHSNSQLPSSLSCEDGIPLGERRTCTLDFGAKGVLVEIVSIYEVGHSSYSLEQVLQQRSLSSSVPAAPANAKSQQEKYPRAMLKLRLSDGRTTLEACESSSRITSLELGETPLGAKLILKGRAAVRRGFLCLGADNVVFKGGKSVEVGGGKGPDEAIAEEVAKRLGRETPGSKPKVVAKSEPAATSKPALARPSVTNATASTSGRQPVAGTSEKKPRVEAALDDVDFEEVDPFEDDELAALDYDQLLFGPAAASTSKKSSKEPAPTAAITSTINARAREKGKGKALTAAEAVDVDIFEDDYDEEIGDLDLEGLNAVMQKSHPTTTTAISDDDERFDAVRGGVAGTRSGHFAKAGTGKGKGKRTAVEDSEEDGDEEVEIVQGPAKRAPTAASRKASAGKPAMPVDVIELDSD